MFDRDRDDEGSSKGPAKTAGANLLLIGGGALAILCFLLSVWDSARVSSERSALQSADVSKELRKLQRQDDRINQAVDFNNANAVKEREDQRKQIQKRRTELNEKRDELQDKQDELEQSIFPRRPWYVVGILIGFLAAFVGGIIYVSSKEHRLIGAILVHSVLTATFSFAVVMAFAGRF